MNISTGLSEISFNRSGETKAASNKAYIWPGYNAGKVQKITKAPEFRGEPVYFKPTEDKKNEILNLISSQEPAYNSNGRVQNSRPYIEPGSLFTAFA